MKRFKQFWLLGAILGLGLVVRLVALGQIPASLNRDEAALAYNAMLLREVGVDEWGRSWPVALESFGDYKLIGYPAILTGFYSVFGVSDLVVRLPSALAGTILIWLAFYWVRQLGLAKNTALAAAAMVAVTPVFIFFSRIAFEANVALTLFVSALALAAFNRKHYWWRDLLSVLFLVGAVLTYNTPLLLLPFLVWLIPWHRGLKNWRSWLSVVVTWLAVGIATFLILLPLTAQKKGITIFSDQTTWDQYLDYRQGYADSAQTLLGNKYVFYAREVITNLVETVSPTFLVTNGGSHPWHQVPNTGHLLLIVFVLGWLGAGALVLNFGYRMVSQRSLTLSKFDSSLFLLLVAMLPAAVTVDAPHATRSLLFFFGWVLLASYGVEHVTKWLPGTELKRACLGICCLILAGGALSYANQYFYLYPRTNIFQSGYAQILADVESQYPEAQVAVVDGGGYQYILTAWYLKLPAQQYLDTSLRQAPDRIGFRYGERVGRYHFIAQAADRNQAESVLIEWNNETMSWSATHF